MNDYFQLAIIAFILAGIGYVLWRGGAANPIGTAKLQNDVGKLRQATDAYGRDIKAISKTVEAEKRRVDGLADRIAAMETDVAGIKAIATATSASVRSIDERQDKMAEDVAGLRADVKNSASQIGLIYQVIVPKGMQ